MTLRDIKNSLKAAGIYTGIILGAGFASGQELILFFVRHGSSGYIGLILAGIVFAISGWAVLDICTKRGINGWSAFAEVVFGKWLGTVLTIISMLFIGVLLCAMMAGSGAMMAQAFDLPFSIGVAALAVICFITFLFDLRGILGINVVLAPILIIGGLFFGIYTFFTSAAPAFADMSGASEFMRSNWVFSSLTYASYNIITAITVLAGLREVVNNRKVAKWAGILGGLFLTLLGIFFAMPLFTHQDALRGVEIPMLAIARDHGAFIEKLYAFILVAAILTTAVASGFSIVEWISSHTRINKLAIKAGVTILAGIAAHFGFSGIVGSIYPVFGFVGLFEIIVVILFFLFDKAGRISDTRARYAKRSSANV